MAPEHAIGVYAVRDTILVLAGRASPNVLCAVHSECCTACFRGGGSVQEPTSDIIVELCLRVALLE